METTWQNFLHVEAGIVDTRMIYSHRSEWLLGVAAMEGGKLLGIEYLVMHPVVRTFLSIA